MDHELIDIQRSIELIAEESILGQAKATVWPDIEEKIALIPVTKIPPGPPDIMPSFLCVSSTVMPDLTIDSTIYLDAGCRLRAWRTCGSLCVRMNDENHLCRSSEDEGGVGLI
jgi:hypothetical protein